ncbi:hypothetical protein [Proteus vulgaris]|uniref:hypothetical protein n=1 Tax=Proteus vulgaris TaxID=585 RepID=UPI0011847CD3|nr:hypothetical protein [Proteus vulgaris]MBG5970235.1 hypothetical protein [Proteus vulgaris]MDM3561202.1 hypothetical protein [Proteus vulgaris]
MTTSNDKPYYNTLFEGLIHHTPSERHIYSIPFEDHIYNVPSKENIDDTPPTESEIMELWDFLLKNKTKFNTI